MIRLLLIIMLLQVGFSASGAIWKITYPRPITDFDQRNQYPVKLLSLALDQTGVNYRLEPSEKVMEHHRSIAQLAENREISVVWIMTSAEHEEKLRPIRIPVFKGLIGWRMFMIKQQQKARFKNVSNLQQLAQLKPIQVLDWADTKILQSNGFDVVTPRNYGEIFTMLNLGQGDFLPRSMVEIWSEFNSGIVGEDIIIEPTLGVRYPAAMYFFVNAKNKTLARLITDGLEKAIETGEFDTLFNLEFNDIIKQAKLKDRFFYELDNPLLPPKTPLDRKELWY